MIYAATIFLSSFLLFLVQPLIARLILPWFGGSAAVWTTCMLFFQVVLLAGYAYAHALGKLQVEARRLAADLDANWEVLAEAVQQVMRRYGVADAYDKLKAISRGKRLERRALAKFVNSLPIPPEAKKRLLALTPARYTGLATELARRV